VTNPDGSTSAYTFNSAGRLLTDDTQSVNGSTNDVSYVYNTDGSYVETAVSTSAGGGAPTTKVYDLSAQGQITSENVTNSDGSTAAYTYNAAGQVLTDDTQSADGATNNVSYSYNADGAYVETSVSTPAGGSAATTTVYDISAQGQITSENVTNPDGSTAAYTYNSSGQVLTDDTVSADGSTNDVSYNYSPDTSYVETSVATPADDSATTTAVYDINAQGQISNENTCTPGTDGSYTDSWSKSDGSSGSYWWNASTSEYLDTWNNSDGIAFTDEYQYAPGGSPTTAGASYTETYTESDGSTGTRQYDSTSNTTMVTWDSSDTGVITSVSTGNSGFIGLLNDGELTNTQNDLTYFNPAVNPTFANFLSAHG
jgi:YD repeat-containing protein